MKISDVRHSQLQFAQQSETPERPEQGVVKVYARDDGRMYKQDSDGAETEIGSGGGDTSGLKVLAFGMDLYVGGYDQKTGTISSTGTLVTGNNTLFSSELIAGGWIGLSPHDEFRQIQSIEDDSHLTLQTSFSTDYDNEQYYVVIPGDDSNDGLRPERALENLIEACNRINQYDMIKGYLNLWIAPGVYPFSVIELNDIICQSGYVNIVGNSMPSITCIRADNVQRINVEELCVTENVAFNDALHAEIGNCAVGSEYEEAALIVSGGNVYACNNTFASHNAGIKCSDNGIVESENNVGNYNGYGLWAERFGKILRTMILISGTASVTQGQNIINGNQTAFTADFQIGDYVKIGDDIRVIATISDFTTMTTTEAFNLTLSDSQIYRRSSQPSGTAENEHIETGGQIV